MIRKMLRGLRMKIYEQMRRKSKREMMKEILDAGEFSSITALTNAEKTERYCRQ